MKVLYFMNHADQGGAALALYDLVLELKKNYTDYYPIVITGKNNKLNQMFTEIGVENYNSMYKNFLSSYKEPYQIIRTALKVRYEIGKRKGIKQIEKIIDPSSIDIIHSNLDRIDIGALYAEKYKIPHIWHIREHGNIHTTANTILSNSLGKTDFDLISVKPDPILYMNKLAQKNNARNLFIAISESVKNEWIKKGIKENLIQLVYDGIREELFISKEELANHSKNDNRLKVIFLGGYCEEKGQKELLDALNLLTENELCEMHIDFYGNGSRKYAEYLRNKANRLIENDIVEFHSYDPEICKKLSTFDVGINCSIEEGFGRVTVEYMMSNICPIVSDKGANPELVKNEKTGLIYKKGDIEDLKNKILFALSNRKTIKQMGILAHERAHANFSMKKHAETIYSIYKSMNKRERENG